MSADTGSNTANGTTDNLGDILAKLAKLQALADRAGTVHEAASAMAKIQRLLFKHNLTMADVYARAAKSDDPTVGFERKLVDIGVTTPWLAQWRQRLLTDIAQTNFCRTIVYVGTSRMVVIGRPQNVAVVPEMYKYLTDTILRLSRAIYARRVERGLSSGTQADGKSWKESFYLGACITIADRLREQRKADTEETQSSALVVSEDSAADAAMRAFFPDLIHGKARKMRIDYTAYTEGIRAAKRISLAQQVSEGTA